MTSPSTKRSSPLAAAPDPAPLPVTIPVDGSAPRIVGAPRPGLSASDGTDRARRDGRFSEGVRHLRVGGASMRSFDERILLVLAGAVAPLGLVTVLLGWWGAAHTPYVFEQIPYLISGGLLGVGLLFLGSFFYFAHWMTQLVKEHRAQSQALVEAVQRLQDQVARAPMVPVGPGVPTPDELDAAAHPLVATGRGTMAHRPGCVVVAGKADLHPVRVDDGLTPCKLCEPFTQDGPPPSVP